MKSSVGGLVLPGVGMAASAAGSARSLQQQQQQGDSARSARSTVSDADGGPTFAHHNEEEDELGIAKDSRYHAATLPGLAASRDRERLAGRSPHAAASSTNFSALARLGGAGASDEAAADIGGLESAPFAPAVGGIRNTAAATAMSAQPGMAFLKGKEMRLARDEENRFAIPSPGHLSNSGASGNVSARGTRSLLLHDASGASIASTTLSEASLGPDTLLQANRRELRAAQERKEEALAQARLRGGSLLSFAAGTGASSAPGPADAPPPPPLKPYVRYTPKYNLPYGDVPRQTAPPPPAPPVPDENELAQVRSTTLFSVTGSLNTHVGITLNTQVFHTPDINQDVFSPVSPPGRKSAGGRRGGSAALAITADSESSPSGEEKEESDGTFLTGVNLSEQQAERHSAAEDRLVTLDDVRSFSALTSVEAAVVVLPRLLRPSREAIQAVVAKQAEPGAKPTQAPIPVLPYLDIPARVDLNELMELSLEALNFRSGDHDPTNRFSFPAASSATQSIVQVKENTFKQYFYSKESQMIIKDTYYWVLLYFFAGGEHAAADDLPRKRGSSDGVPEMFAYRAYASNLKKYAEQEGFLTKQKEWLRECEKIRQAEKDSHAQIGTQLAQTGATGAPTAANANQPGGGGGGGGGGQHTLPSHKEELQFPPPPVLTSKQKRQPLVLLGDIPHFDVQAKLNTGPIPNAMFAVPQSPASPTKRPTRALLSSSASSSRPDYSSSSFILSALKSRISTNFVKLFLTISSAHKDFFYLHYYDLLAQIIYYSFLVAYPASRPLINHSFFKLRLLQLTSFWIMGFIPSNLGANLAKWRGDLQFITGETGVNRNYQPPPTTDADATSGAADAGDLDLDGPSTAASQAIEDYVAPPTQAAGSSTHTTQYALQLEKRLNAHLAANSKTARAKQQALLASTGNLSVGSQLLHATSSTTNLPAVGNNLMSPNKQRRGPANGAGGSPDVSASIGHLSSTSAELTGDLLLDVGQKAARNPHRVPMRVTRRKVELHHSALINDFLISRNFAAQSNHALRIPLSVPASGEEERAAFLDDLLTYNEQQRDSTDSLKESYASSKSSFNRLQSKQKKEVAEIARKFEQERERALREASAFSKTLVAEYQERRYQDLKAPSKSLALRRLGHYRQQKNEGANAIADS